MLTLSDPLPKRFASAYRPISDCFGVQDRRPFDFQETVWRHYLQGRSGLLHAPNGIGRTYAVWLGPVMQHWTEPVGTGRKNPLPLRVIWITPLREPASETLSMLKKPLPHLQPDWRVEIRTGDTAQSAKLRQRTNMPFALIATPESLSLLLPHPDASNLFRGLSAVIVEEWL
jgi:ATP-dependent Lhr-like helicase